eukprot:COSAG02_NODE_1807_length_10865_cov_25.450585_2_plen_118_part_00
MVVVVVAAVVSLPWRWARGACCEGASEGSSSFSFVSSLEQGVSAGENRGSSQRTTCRRGGTVGVVMVRAAAVWALVLVLVGCVTGQCTVGTVSGATPHHLHGTRRQTFHGGVCGWVC